MRATPSGRRRPISSEERETVRFSVLASGSGGNAVYLESGQTQLLIDGGLSGRELARRLACLGVEPASLNGILVTHEHRDHILGIGVFARRFSLPVYMHPATQVAAGPLLGQLPAVVPFQTSRVFAVGDVQVTPFPVPHDAVNPVGFTFCANGSKLGLATDMGYVPLGVRERLKGSHTLILESNHDLTMLQEGPYAWPLKQRILSRRGHLSNDTTRSLLEALMHSDLDRVVLAHLSEVNNQQGLALEAAREVLARSGRPIRLVTARQDEAGALMAVREKRGFAKPSGV